MDFTLIIKLLIIINLLYQGVISETTTDEQNPIKESIQKEYRSSETQ